MHLTYRKSCRICGSRALTKVIELGPQHLQGSFVHRIEADTACVSAQLNN
jgi:hypothetical protein